MASGTISHHLLNNFYCCTETSQRNQNYTSHVEINRESMGNCMVLSQYVYKQNIDKIIKILVLNTHNGIMNSVDRFS